jgi:hypothetical protein
VYEGSGHAVVCVVCTKDLDTWWFVLCVRRIWTRGGLCCVYEGCTVTYLMSYKLNDNALQY